MICKRCSTAADVLDQFKEIRKTLPNFNVSNLRTTGVILHELCTGCDCQHDVESHLKGVVKNKVALGSEPLATSA